MAEGESIVEAATEVPTVPTEEAVVETPTLPSDEVKFEVPEKFEGKSIEDVIKSYQELEKIKGGGQESEEGEKPLEPEKGSEEPSKVEQEQYNKFAASYDKNGSLSEAEYAELAEQGYTKAQVDNEINSRNDLKEYQNYKADKALTDVLEPLGGGKEKFKQVADWANKSKTPEEVKAFNKELSIAGPMAQQALLKGLYSDYESAGDSTNEVLHTGQAQRTSGRGYASESEMFKDMDNPAYHTDPKFNKAVQDKLGRTDTVGWSF